MVETHTASLLCLKTGGLYQHEHSFMKNVGHGNDARLKIKTQVVDAMLLASQQMKVSHTSYLKILAWQVGIVFISVSFSFSQPLQDALLTK